MLRGATALDYRVDHGVGSFHVIVKSLDVGVVAALAGFLQADKARYVEAAQWIG